MPRIPPVDRDLLDADTRALLKEKSGNNQWNVFEGIANHTPSLKGLFALQDAISSEISAVEHEVVAFEIARFNGCGYCIPAHRFVCSEIGVGVEDIEALTRGELLENQPWLMTIQLFVRAALLKKGRLEDDEFDQFQSQGISVEKMIAILAEIGLYTWVNYFNRLAGTEIETRVLPHVSDQVNWITEPDR